MNGGGVDIRGEKEAWIEMKERTDAMLVVVDANVMCCI
jgi:hypothetical protein